MARGVSIRVLVADDHPLVRQGVAAVVAAQSDMSIVGEAGDGQQAVELFRKADDRLYAAKMLGRNRRAVLALTSATQS